MEVVLEADSLVLDGGDEAVAAPHGQPEVSDCPQSSNETERHAQAGQERTEVTVQPSHGQGGVLAQEHLQDEEGQTQNDEEAEVHHEKDDTTVSDDGLREVEEGVEGEGEGPGGGERVGAPGPLGGGEAADHLAGVGLLSGRRWRDVKVGLRPARQAQRSVALQSDIRSGGAERRPVESEESPDQ